jgi:hypothetical protein
MQGKFSERWARPRGVRDKLAGTNTALVGLETNNLQVLFTDAYPFTLVGLLGITFGQLSPDYGTIRHSNADTLDKVDAATLAYDAELVAVSSFWIPSPATGVPLASTPDDDCGVRRISAAPWDKATNNRRTNGTCISNFMPNALLVYPDRLYVCCCLIPQLHPPSHIHQRW